MLRKTCSRLEIEGGWYAVVRVPATRSDDELAVDLLTKKGIYVHPGHFYDFATDGLSDREPDHAGAGVRGGLPADAVDVLMSDQSDDLTN